MGRFIGIVLYLFAVHNAWGQRENGAWYFGNQAGVTFNDCSPAALVDGALTSPAGCATASDRFGKLLFYSNGESAYTAGHQLMKNGDSLAGDPTATQSALIVPQPGSDSLFYLFTLGFKDQQGALSYSVINMNGDGGNGEVLADRKNIFVSGSLTEKLAGIFHANRKDVWIVVHGLNTTYFYAYLLSEQGLADPVRSGTGLVNSSGPGYMASSLDGKKLVSAISYLNTAEIFDFDPTSGALSGGVPLYFSDNVYGVCFSPDRSRVYATESPNRIYQFDVSSGNEAKIRDSKTLVGTNSHVPAPGAEGFAGALQVGLDGRIYHAVYNSDHLAIIEKPNARGPSCGFKNDGLALGGKRSAYGLPTFVPREFRAPVSLQPAVHLGNDTLLCDGNTLVLDATCLECRYLWQDGSVQATFTVNAVGTYWVAVENRCGVYRDSIRVDFEKCLAEEEVPNVITPNGDHKNDTFAVPALLSGRWELRVYNRWGRLLYQNENYQNDMDASRLSGGTYFYYLSDSHSARQYKGWFEVLR